MWIGFTTLAVKCEYDNFTMVTAIEQIESLKVLPYLHLLKVLVLIAASKSNLIFQLLHRYICSHFQYMFLSFSFLDIVFVFRTQKQIQQPSQHLLCALNRISSQTAMVQLLVSRLHMYSTLIHGYVVASGVLPLVGFMSHYDFMQFASVKGVDSCQRGGLVEYVEVFRCDERGSVCGFMCQMVWKLVALMVKMLRREV